MRKLFCILVLGLAAGVTMGGCSSDDDDSDTCADACNKLDDCGLCAAVDGECLSVSECVSGCREEGTQQAAQCVLDVSGCNEEGLASCVAGSGG